MVRVAGLMDQVAAGVAVRSPDGLTPQAALAEIRKRAFALAAEQAKLWKRTLRPALEAQGIVVAEIEDLEPAELEELERVFDREIFPVLTPLAVGPGPAVPVHLGPLAQPRPLRARPGDRRGAVRARQGARAAAALPADRLARPVRAARAGDPPLPRLALPDDGDRRVHDVPGHARRRLLRLRRGGRPARGGRAGAAPPPLRRPGAPRDLGLVLDADAPAAEGRPRRGRGAGLPRSRPARPLRAARARLARAARPEGGSVDPGGAGALRVRRPRRALRRAAQEPGARAPPVRLVRAHLRVVRANRGDRPEDGCRQDDASTARATTRRTCRR